MQDVSTFRLYLLRATYLLIVVGLGFMARDPPSPERSGADAYRRSEPAGGGFAAGGLGGSLSAQDFAAAVLRTGVEVHLDPGVRASALVRRPVGRGFEGNVERLPHGNRAVSARDPLGLCAGELCEAAGRQVERKIAVGVGLGYGDGSRDLRRSHTPTGLGMGEAPVDSTRGWAECAVAARWF